MARPPSGLLGNWEYPKKSGIRIREVLNSHRGAAFGASYLVTLPLRITGAKIERKQFMLRADAEDWAQKAFDGRSKDGESHFVPTDEERREFLASLPDLRKHNLGVSEAVRFAVKGLRAEGRTKTLPQVVDELVASKKLRCERGDLRERSHRDFKHRGERLSAGFEGRRIAEVTADDIKAWLNKLEVGPRSNQNYLAAAGEVFRYATQKRYIGVSPLDHLTDVDRKELCGRGGEAKEPSILTPDQAGTLLKAALEHPESDLLGAITLGLFCGLRTEEIKRLEWEHVRLTDSPPIVTIGAGIAKKRRIRHVDLPPVAVTWLSLVANREGQVTRSTHYNDFQKRFQSLLEKTKFGPWKSNAMRHSFGSYHYALHGNPLETSRQLGHKASDQVLFDHYRALATKAAAEKYFAIRPPATAGTVVQFA